MLRIPEIPDEALRLFYSRNQFVVLNSRPFRDRRAHSTEHLKLFSQAQVNHFAYHSLRRLTFGPGVLGATYDKEIDGFLRHLAEKAPGLQDLTIGIRIFRRHCGARVCSSTLSKLVCQDHGTTVSDSLTIAMESKDCQNLNEFSGQSGGLYHWDLTHYWIMCRELKKSPSSRSIPLQIPQALKTIVLHVFGLTMSTLGLFKGVDDSVHTFRDEWKMTKTFTVGQQHCGPQPQDTVTRTTHRFEWKRLGSDGPANDGWQETARGEGPILNAVNERETIAED